MQRRAVPAGIMVTQAERASRPEDRGHYKSLDGLRGLAIVMVLLHHAFRSNYESGGETGRLLGELLIFGRTGVDLFFVLSGFLITGILLDTRNDPGFFKKFYGRRILRIFPLYYATLFFLFALTPWMHLQWQGMRWLLLFDLQNLRTHLVGKLMLAPNLGLFHFWSLAVEEQFYLIWPAAVFYIKDRRTLFRFTVASALGSLLLRLAILSSGHGAIAIHCSTITRADTLLAGAILAMLFRSDRWSRVMRAAPAGFFISASLILLSVAVTGPDEHLRSIIKPYVASSWVSGLRYSMLAFCFGCLLVCSLRPSSFSQALFGHRLLRFFGRYSYGIYVLHVPAITLLLFPVRDLLHTLTHSKGLAVLGSGMISITLSIVAAMISFHLLERPFLKLKRFLNYERTQPLLRDPVASAITDERSDRIIHVVEAIPQHSVSTR